MSSNEIAELVEKVRNKDNDAWAKLYSATLPRAMYTASRFVRNTTEAEDIVQDSYISAWNHLDSLKDSTKFQPWLDRIVANRCKNRLEKKDPVLFSDMMICDDEGEEAEPEFENRDISFMPAENLDIKETQRIVGEVIDSLPMDQKMTVTLFYMDENSIADIAETMGCSEGTVKSRLNRAREAIKAKILAIEKRDGIKLAGIPFSALLIAFFKEDTTAYAATYAIGGVAAGSTVSATTAVAAGGATATGTGAASTGTAAVSTTAAGGAGIAGAVAASAVAKATGAAATIAAKSLGTKIAIGALALAVAGGGTAAVVSNTTRSENVQIRQESEFTEEKAYFSELYEFVDCNDFRDYKKIAELVRNSNEHDINPGRQMEYKKEAYDGEKVVKSFTGKGVCFINNHTVYIGELLNGVPNGKGILVLSISEKHVNFSYGNWENGALSGEGITGKNRGTTFGYEHYECYDAEIYEGAFVNDKMDGPVTINSEFYVPEINYYTKEIFSTDANDGRYIINKKWVYQTRNGNGSDYYLCGDRPVNLDKIDKLVLYNQCAWDSTIAKSGYYLRAYEPDPRFEGEKKPDVTAPDIFGIREYSMIGDLLDIDIQKEIESSDTQDFTDAEEGIKNSDTQSFTDDEIINLASRPIPKERVLENIFLYMPFYQVTDHINYFETEFTRENISGEDKYEIATGVLWDKYTYKEHPAISFTSDEVALSIDAFFGKGTAVSVESEGILIEGMEIPEITGSIYDGWDPGDALHPVIEGVRAQDGYAVIYGKSKNDFNLPKDDCKFELWLKPVKEKNKYQPADHLEFYKFKIEPNDQ